MIQAIALVVLAVAVLLAGIGTFRLFTAHRIRAAEYARYDGANAVGFRRDPRIREKINERIEHNYKKSVRRGFMPLIGLLYVVGVLAIAGFLLYGIVWIVHAAWSA